MAMRRLTRISERLNVEPLLARHRAFSVIKTGSYPTMPESPQSAARPIHEAIGKTRKISLSKDQEALCEVMGVKAGYLHRQMLLQGVSIVPALKAGVNPFNEDSVRPRFMASVCSMLLESGFTKKSLKERLLRDNPDWDSRTAANHVSTVIACLMTLGALDKTTGERFVIK